MLERKITVEECCVIVGCGKSHLYALLNANEIESWLVGKRKRVISENSAYEYVAQKKAAEIAKQRAGKDGG
ncbi:excisionase family DNA-binding protein [Qipengyuania sp. XHP0211]|uniref:excisionase family DNA-binding protein n=1 Tax=Qipengyuania sp. XHP0211 TaxID=3038079 RepID=UPI00241D992B|nr:excisionase family DNA-binding protein [Qipengyuania sp. XHP0211]MDG5750219.1 excisionase family DNA-binding protein [Qipengyuania sp. XHP0211]